ncbi:TBPIP-domain-containing protein [Lichtheimia hyalospora FSU 10163]|nr:TBPIP-domain-containing protein [Lichtheimia hyalospora FSU 10163]
MGKRKTTSPKSEEEDIVVRNYLRKVNRPYSAADVYNNLQGKYQKSSIVKALDRLTEQETVVSKAYGKMTIYSIKQDKNDIQTPEQLEAMNINLEKLAKEFEIVMQENRHLSTTLRDITTTPLTEDAKEMTSKFIQENSAYRQRLEKIKQGQTLVAPEERKQVDATFEQVRKEWRTRRKMFVDIFHTVSEHSADKPEELKEALGIEEDSIPYENIV